jgi:N6-adenosine-specific RNA methylase IME4
MKATTRTTVDQGPEAGEHPDGKLGGRGRMITEPQAKHYRVIYADPPWTFSTYSRKGKGRSAEAYYDCMSLEEIKSVPVKQWTTKDSVLFLWTTDPLLEQALGVIRAWGFTYKTVGFHWAKLKRTAAHGQYTDESFFCGLGFWTRANPELCLLATRGNPNRRKANVQKLVISPRREHSRKPDEVYERIEALCEGPYLELFARSTRDGWDSRGVEVDAFESGKIPARRWASSSHPGAAAPMSDD